MDTKEELKENKRKFENGEISENEFNERRELILTKLLGKPKEHKSSHVNKPKETDLYAVLELNQNATEAEIKSKYRQLALKNHPDKNGGVETEKWNAISNAYQILSDQDKRFLYDNYGTINDSSEGKPSFNSFVGGDSWRSYIGDIEVGLWLFSFMDNESSPEFSTEQKKLRHANRVSKIAHFLHDKLSRFPKQDDVSSEFESRMKNLNQEAQKLYMEPNGKELLPFLGEIYVSKAKAHLKNYSVAAMSNRFSGFFNGIGFTADLVSGFFSAKTKSGPLNQEEISKLFWRLSRSEISLIAQKACEEVLNNRSQSADKNQSESDKNHLANSLHLLGQVWLEVSKKT